MSDKSLSKRQELVVRIFQTIVAKQEIGKIGATEIEQIMKICEAVADKVLEVK